MEIKSVSQAALQRLPTYLTYLRTLPRTGPANISATALAAALGLGEVQVRKDLAAVSGAGKPKIGYLVSELIGELESFLGYDDVSDAVIVGTGKLGRALLDYAGFADYGLNIVAGFDLDPALEGVTDSGKQIFALEKLPDLVKRLKIKIGIITVPADCAQDICDRMVENGIRAIWNFAPTHLHIPEGVLIKNENIAASLAVLSNQLMDSIGK